MTTRTPTSPGLTSLHRNTWESEVLARIKDSIDGTRFSDIARETGVHPETVRRYLTRGRPSAFFIASLCRAYGLPVEWVLFGSPDKKNKGQSSAIEPKPSLNGKPGHKSQNRD